MYNKKQEQIAKQILKIRRLEEYKIGSNKKTMWNVNLDYRFETGKVFLVFIVKLITL